jgi:hypothetical protein
MASLTHTERLIINATSRAELWEIWDELTRLKQPVPQCYYNKRISLEHHLKPCSVREVPDWLSITDDLHI